MKLSMTHVLYTGRVQQVEGKPLLTSSMEWCFKDDKYPYSGDENHIGTTHETKRNNTMRIIASRLPCNRNKPRKTRKLAKHNLAVAASEAPILLVSRSPQADGNIQSRIHGGRSDQFTQAA